MNNYALLSFCIPTYLPTVLGKQGNSFTLYNVLAALLHMYRLDYGNSPALLDRNFEQVEGSKSSLV